MPQVNVDLNYGLVPSDNKQLICLFPLKGLYDLFNYQSKHK